MVITKLKKYSDGEILYATNLNADNSKNFSFSMKNHVRTLQDRSVTYSDDKNDLWGDAYVDSNGRNNSMVEGNLTEFSSNKYQIPTSTTLFYVIIEAAAVDDFSEFQINSCNILEISSGKWILYTDVGTYEENRARIYNTLFANNGYKGGVVEDHITGLTALKTIESGDVGRNCIASRCRVAVLASTYATTTLSADFDAVSGNTVSIWGNSAAGDDAGSKATFIKVGSVTKISDSDPHPDVTIWNTDTSALDATNPADTDSSAIGNFGWGVNTTAILLCTSTISNVQFTESYGGGETPNYTHEYYDFTNTGGIPVLTDGSSEDVSSLYVLEHTIPADTFVDTPSTVVFSTVMATWEDGSSIQYKLLNDSEDSGWLESDEVLDYTQFTGSPIQLYIKLTAKTISPTAGTPAIYGFGVYTE